MIRVGLLWHSTVSTNLGVRSLTLGQLALLDRAAGETGTKIEAYTLGHAAEPGVIETRYVGDHVTYSAHARIGIRGGLEGILAGNRRLADLDLMLDIGGGDCFTDIYGLRRYASQVLTKLCALRNRVPLVLAPQTIGPFTTPVREAVATWILRRCERVMARDELSRAYAAKLAKGARVCLCSDLSFAVPRAKGWRRREGRGTDRVRVGMNVSRILFDGGAASRGFRFACDYPSLTRSLIEHFLARGDCEVHLIPHVREDLAPIESLARRYPELGVLRPRDWDPAEVWNFTSGLDFMTGARLHACLDAFSAGVPMVALAYSPKATGLFQTLGYPYVCDLSAESTDEVCRRVVAGFENRAVLREATERGLGIAAAGIETYVSELKDLLRGVMRRRRS